MPVSFVLKVDYLNKITCSVSDCLLFKSVEFYCDTFTKNVETLVDAQCETTTV